ncbi:hypothetical protein ABE59_02940 [Bacillus safensis]|nr:hypothetical protein [Bacillus safensis]
MSSVIFEQEGIKLNIQSHPNDFIELNTEAIRMIRALDKDWIKLVYSVPMLFSMMMGLVMSQNI